MLNDHPRNLAYSQARSPPRVPPSTTGTPRGHEPSRQGAAACAGDRGALERRGSGPCPCARHWHGHRAALGPRSQRRGQGGGRRGRHRRRGAGGRTPPAPTRRPQNPSQPVGGSPHARPLRAVPLPPAAALPADGQVRAARAPRQRAGRRGPGALLPLRRPPLLAPRRAGARAPTLPASPSLRHPRSLPPALFPSLRPAPNRAPADRIPQRTSGPTRSSLRFSTLSCSGKECSQRSATRAPTCSPRGPGRCRTGRWCSGSSWRPTRCGGCTTWRATGPAKTTPQHGGSLLTTLLRHPDSSSTPAGAHRRARRPRARPEACQGLR